MSEMFILVLNLFRYFFFIERQLLVISQMCRMRWVSFSYSQVQFVGHILAIVQVRRPVSRSNYIHDRARSWRCIDRYSSRRTILSIPDARRGERDTVEFSSRVLGQARAHLENFQTLRIPTNASRIVIQKYFPGVVTRRNCSSPRGI